MNPGIIVAMTIESNYLQHIFYVAFKLWCTLNYIYSYWYFRNSMSMLRGKEWMEEIILAAQSQQQSHTNWNLYKFYKIYLELT